jgi:hypothetical protein
LRVVHWNFTGVPPVTDGSAGLDYIKAQKRTLPLNGANHDSAWHWGYAFGALAALEQAGGCSPSGGVVFSLDMSWSG